MEARNNLFPVFLKLEDLDVLIVGGGNVGLEKLSGVLKSSPRARITLVAGVIGDEVRKLAEGKDHIRLVERNFQDTDLEEKDIAILATDDQALHKRIRETARKRRMLINVADTPDLCDFYLGSVVTKGHLKIGISTNGKSPTIAKRIREYLEEALPENMNELLDNMQAIRARLKGDFAHKVKMLNEVTRSWLDRER